MGVGIDGAPFECRPNKLFCVSILTQTGVDMATHWITDPQGVRQFYRVGESIFTFNGILKDGIPSHGKHRFDERDGRWYTHEGGQLSYFVTGNTIASANGRPRFYYE